MEADDPPNQHPGKLLREKVFRRNYLTIRKAAELLHVSEVQLSYVVTGKCGLSTEMCLKIEQVFGENAEEWAIRQTKYDLAKAAPKISEMNLKRYS